MDSKVFAGGCTYSLFTRTHGRGTQAHEHTEGFYFITYLISFMILYCTVFSYLVQLTEGTKKFDSRGVYVTDQNSTQYMLRSSWPSSIYLVNLTHQARLLARLQTLGLANSSGTAGTAQTTRTRIGAGWLRWLAEFARVWAGQLIMCNNFLYRRTKYSMSYTSLIYA